MCGENCSDQYKINREEQDDYAISSYTQSQRAAAAGLFDAEIVPVTVKTRKSCELYASNLSVSLVKLFLVRKISFILMCAIDLEILYYIIY